MLWLINRFVLVINLNMVWMKLYVDVNFMQFNIWYVNCDSWFDRRIFDSRFSRFFVNPKFKGYRFYVIIIIIVVIRWCDVLDHDDRREMRWTDNEEAWRTKKASTTTPQENLSQILWQVSAILFLQGRALVAAAVRCSLKSNLDLGQD